MEIAKHKEHLARLKYYTWYYTPVNTERIELIDSNYGAGYLYNDDCSKFMKVLEKRL